jgi:serine protease Do
MQVIREGRKKSLDVTVTALDSRPTFAGGESNFGGSGIDGKLGMVVDNITRELSNKLDVDNGVVVRSVSPNGPAAEAGLEEGDVITQIGFKAITDLNNFEEVEGNLPSDSLLPIRFVRNGTAVFRTIATP